MRSENADNTKIYFALVPKETSELPLPASKFMISAIEYAQPAASEGPFFTPPSGAGATVQPNTGQNGGTPQLVGAAVPMHLSGSQPMQLGGSGSGSGAAPPMMAMATHGGGVMHASPPMTQPIVTHSSAPLMPGAMAAVNDAAQRMGGDWGGGANGRKSPAPTPAPSAAAGGGGASWVCAACTYANPAQKNFCEVRISCECGVDTRSVGGRLISVFVACSEQMCNAPHHPKSAAAAAAGGGGGGGGGSGAGPASHHPPTVLNMTPTPNPSGSQYPPFA